jgi:hypothetical protein
MQIAVNLWAIRAPRGKVGIAMSVKHARRGEESGKSIVWT